MRFSDTLLMCLKNLLKRKLRTLLTMLGVVVGTAALILTISLGLATEAAFDSMLDEMDVDLTMINVWPRWGGGGGMVIIGGPGGSGMPEAENPLNRDAINAINAIPHVVVASPEMSSWLQFRSGPYQMNATVTGIDPLALYMMRHPLAAGRMLGPSDEGFTAVFGAEVELNFDRAGVWHDWVNSFPRWILASWGEDVGTLVDVINDPILFSYDQRFTWGGMEDDAALEDVLRPVTTLTMDVVGLLEPVDWSVDRNIYMDIEAVMQLEMLRQQAEQDTMQEWGHFSPIRPEISPNFERAMVRTDDIRNTQAVSEAINEMGFDAWYQGAWIDQMRNQQRTMQNMLVGIAAVSIFVAAISIANTMIMSVYERTREIGVMKVIGGAISDIRRLFLLEASLIGLFGGILGVGLSLGLSYVLNNFEMGILTDQTGWIPDTGQASSIITPWLCGVALVFASVIGLVSGYYPAWRATRLSALAAIRTD